MRRTIAASVGTGVVLAGLATIAPAGQAAAQAGGRTHVVRPGHSIQAAVDRARPGDTIRLKAGHYDGGVLVRKRLTIRGEGNKTIVRPGRRDHCAKAKVPGMGFCVVGWKKRPVKGVTIQQLVVRNFKGTGVFGTYTDRMKVQAVLAKHNGEYGIAQYNSTRGRFVWNWTLDNRDDAGLYVGDTANAYGTEIAWNHSSGNTLGLLIRHARHIKVHHNSLTYNCTGIALVDDSQRTGQGNTQVWKNRVSMNNRICEAHGPVPALSGTGILFFGGDHNEIVKNTVHRNRGKLPYSGGIVLFRGTPPRNRPAHHNLIKTNNVRGNKPYDLVNNSGSTTNRFRDNTCGTSNPNGLC
ncbi:right-handed parallel beta-helix repeat-containing protein [Actinomadura sp. KC06]|uniref:right-handed parallel beta-helix repeat-containing protein n=1 Tax=Actinomadura sp. KC06 TaxID=2530369 RepID=UPI0014050442|nr:right-handed parallel beta-helix repeat-containing protein [Actinomadura sp. KC06]